MSLFGHIYIVDDPGYCGTCDVEGFAAIGIGSRTWPLLPCQDIQVITLAIA